MDFKIGIFFSKTKNLKYISHLDLMRLFLRALRRSGLPLKFSQGFNPHPKFSIKQALKLGVESENEEACFELVDKLSSDVIQKLLQDSLPNQIQIKQIYLNA